ncbi:hypothetical protein [Hymenobacter glacialis]|uniref:Outer membrane protein beta-barrel domain-containing protein n=1 Tax=Hymenobacter glacialis TaxID=1908236 RepID=A0A1G1SUL4_9BACT|nr:hypothetical protein [Hymenobacter glacialis]OGX82314.1 hypothetical protein BEN48_05025 [Hymenobacter glacialis]
MRFLLALFACSVLALPANAQGLKLKNYNIGYRLFEMESALGTPLSLGRFLQDPYTYQQFLDGIDYTRLSGGGGAYQWVPMLYLTAEFHRPAAASRFWRNHTVQAGLVLSNRIELSGLSIGNDEFLLSPGSQTDFTYKTNVYSLVQQQQFVGATLGLNRRFRLVNRLHFLTGLHGQGSVAVVHGYTPQWDSTTLVVQNGQVLRRERKTTQLPYLKGKNYFQWQLFIPIGLEVAVYKQEVFVRLEADFGIRGNQFRSKELAALETHGVGLWLTYQPKY